MTGAIQANQPFALTAGRTQALYRSDEYSTFVNQGALTSRALRYMLDRDTVWARRLQQELLTPPLRLPAVTVGSHPWPELPDPAIEDATVELLRWQIEASTGRPQPVTLHDLYLGTASSEWGARLHELARHVQGRRDRFLIQHVLTPEDLALTLRWALDSVAPDRVTTVKSSARKEQHLTWLLGAPWPDALLSSASVARPLVGDVMVDECPVFIRVQCGLKVELLWRLVLGAAALAAFHAAPTQAPRKIRVGLWSVPHSTLLTVGLLDLIPAEALPTLLQTFGPWISQTDWRSLGQARSSGRLPVGVLRHLHPVLALQAVNSQAKVIGARLQQDPRHRDAPSLRREQAYLYEVKARAAQVMLDQGVLRPVRLDRGALLVVGETSVGSRGFHLPLERFRAYAAQMESETSSLPGRIQDAEVVLAQYDLTRALALLTRIIASKRMPDG
ncbi:hypothetical protein [Deinococcus aquatilis]|uniref:hypothetical protein n=1 Tax=Deinococcus aquatilis TaxID=519440 RepID=UPI001FDF1046|nr:hypothetical protein [Deinococcus aquatilis]